MTSPYDRPDQQALEQLERVTALLEGQLASWRRRTIKAEHELEELKTRQATYATPEAAELRRQIHDLEGQNEALRQRITASRHQAEQLRSRLRFIEERTVGDAG
ncbi:MAG: hypothetical protein ABI647_14975 [Gemmatimonadota bacterium]